MGKRLWRLKLLWWWWHHYGVGFVKFLRLAQKIMNPCNSEAEIIEALSSAEDYKSAAAALAYVWGDDAPSEFDLFWRKHFKN
jgi:hypothetical protein